MDLAAAIQRAIAADSCLQLPPGEIHVGKLDPFVVQGHRFALRGAGRRLTTIVQDDPAAGLAFDCSQGNRYENVVQVSGLTLLAGHPNCGLALAIDYGADAFPSVEDRTMSHVHNVEARGWRDGFYFRNLWNGDFRGLFAAGDEAGYVAAGAGSGTALTLAGCVACQFTNTKFAWFNLGAAFVQAGDLFGCQGVNFTNFVTVEVLSALVNNPKTGDGFGALNVSNFVFDNGNREQSRHANVVLQGCNTLSLVGGIMLQNGGMGQVQLTNCVGAKVQSVDFAAQPGVKASIWLGGSTQDSIVSGCRFASPVPAVWLGPQTKNNLVQGNVYGEGGNVNLGKNNRVERS